MKGNVVELAGVRCAGHGGEASLADAALEGWKYCRTCHGFICPRCIERFRVEADGMCPGSTTTGSQHPMDIDELPYDEVVRFARQALKAEELSPVLYELFFRELQDEIQPIRALHEEPEEEEDDTTSVLRREHWRRYGMVLVKRRRGRYVTWEQVR